MPSHRSGMLRAWSLGLLVLVGAGCAFQPQQETLHCSADADCGAGYRCTSGGCVAKGGPVCGSPKACGSAEVCSDGACIVASSLRGYCELSQYDLDFGITKLHTESSEPIRVLNWTAVPLMVTVDTIPFDPVHGGFSLRSDFAAGDYTVPAGEVGVTPGVLEIPVAFEPRAYGEFSGDLVVSAPEMCAYEVTLRGTGADGRLECSPNVDLGTQRVCRVDFDHVNPGAKVVKQVSFRNLSNVDVRLTPGPILQPVNVYDAPYDLVVKGVTYLLPAGGTPTTIDVSFQPTLLGEQDATLTYTTDDPISPSGSVGLVGFGGPHR